MTRACNFPISKKKRCTQPIADDKPNCGRHHCEISIDQLGEKPTIYKKGGELHVWADKPDDVYCLIHNDPAYQVLYQVAGETPPCCLKEMVVHRDSNGDFHREDGPAWISPDGSQVWWQHNGRHREDGPAEIFPDGEKQWWLHGNLRREGGPAITGPDGTQEWYLNGERHREDGPAVIKANSEQQWWLHDELHREDGPAIIKANGSEEWYWHGEQVTKEEHAKLLAKKKTKKSKR